uniref:Exocyst complex component Sec8 n=1 Tax=Acrobeloides nanus TaxID=290746 RepID=A0A914EAN8_9BILA
MKNNDNNSTNDMPVSSGLLINVIRTLTTSVSEDQKNLEKSRLERGYKESEQTIDTLLKAHEGDVSSCLDSFRKVSNQISASRQRIQNVKNSLQTCKALLQSRRDDLKKLWLENSEQKCVSTFLDQIYEIKQLDSSIENHLKQSEYKNAVNELKKADILLNGPLSGIEGLNQLRGNITDLSQSILNKIIENMMQYLLVEPFERQMLELMKNLDQTSIHESPICVALAEKYSTTSEGTKSDGILAQFDQNVVNNKISECLEALLVFDQLDTAIDEIFTRVPTSYTKLLQNTISLFKLLIKDIVSDATYLAKFMQIAIIQLKSSYARFETLAEGLKNIRHSSSSGIRQKFWDATQSVLENLISQHLDIYTTGKQIETRETKRTLFRFDNTSVSSQTTTESPTIQRICPPNPYNVTAIFHLLNRFSMEIEKQINISPCSLHVFLHAFVMDKFIERIKNDMEAKVEIALKKVDVWSAITTIPSHNVKILSSCIRIYELCTEIFGLIRDMESYTQRFAALWLLIIEDYINSANIMYSQVTKSRSTEGDSFIENPKISAAWAVDEDISRLLKSLPSWSLINQAATTPTPGNEFTPTGRVGIDLKESEQEIRQRTQREAEILIGNLGTQKQIKKTELITDMDHVRALACMHESLQWFATSMRNLLANLSKQAQEIIKCRIQMSTINGQVVEELLRDALNERLQRIENMSDTCLLMLHLELRVHCFYHLLPLARARNVLPQDELDSEVVDFGKDLTNYHKLLSDYLASNKVKYLFDGLGHLCASIFIHSSQHMQKLTENGKKRVCRNIFAVQQRLSHLTGRKESELDRARTFFELLNKEPDQLLASIMERGASFSYLEYTYLLALAVRSHHSLSSQPGALETRVNRLREILSQSNRKSQEVVHA